MRIQKEIFKNSQEFFSLVLKNCPSPAPPFTQAIAAKNLTSRSPEGIFYPCTQKKSPPLCEKSRGHVWLHDQLWIAIPTTITRSFFRTCTNVPTATSTAATRAKWAEQKSPRERGVWKPGETSSIWKINTHAFISHNCTFLKRFFSPDISSN